MSNKNKNNDENHNKDELIANFLFNSRAEEKKPSKLNALIYFSMLIFFIMMAILFSPLFLLPPIFLIFFHAIRRIFLRSNLRLKRYSKSWINLDSPADKKYLILKDNNNLVNDILFIDLGNKFMGLCIFKINDVSLHLYDKFNEFVRVTYGKKDIPLIWYQTHEPMNENKLLKSNNITDRAKNNLKLYPKEERYSKTIGIGGVWRVSIIFGTYFIIESRIKRDNIISAYEEIQISRIKLLTAFEGSFSSLFYEKLDVEEIINLIESPVTSIGCNFFATGSEIAKNFLPKFPKMVIKSINSKYPAEFTVPTDIEYDIGPLGKSIEPEFQSVERDIGLKHIDTGILVSGDSIKERFKANLKILFEALIQEYSIIILTKNKDYRKFLQYVDELTIFPFKEYGLDIFDSGIIDRNQYITELERIFEISFGIGDNSPLYNILFDIYENEKPTINTLLQLTEDKLRNEGNSMTYQDRQAINSLKNYIELLNKGESSRFFSLKNINFEDNLGNAIFEINLGKRNIRKFIILLFLLKLAIRSKRNNIKRNTIVLIDEADIVFSKERLNYKDPSSNDLQLLEFFEFIKVSGIIPVLSISNPKYIVSDILNSIKNIIVSRTKDFSNIMALRQPLNLHSGYSQTSEEHEPVLYSEKRKYGYQFEYLSTLEPNEYLFKNPQAKNCFPIYLDILPIDNFEYNDSYIKDRLYKQHPNLLKLPDTPKFDTVLEKDFLGNQKNIQDVIRILRLLIDYPGLSMSGLISGTGIHFEDMKYYLKRLLEIRYLTIERKKSGTHTRNEYKITKKAIDIYNSYIDKNGVELFVQK